MLCQRQYRDREGLLVRENQHRNCHRFLVPPFLKLASQISIQVFATFSQNIGLAHTSRELAPPIWEILDPPQQCFGIDIKISCGLSVTEKKHGVVLRK